ncbi:DJ-1/PfpI family protein [Oleiharenicola lentus]|uniref:DJ-1/PfpI family protein n=1 Tax=Oleiharenicola lentus TaxID=2508720 RepID=A0A4Q1C7A3_9BACT|nr:DJ-1/PfpI family protein [Oleiharenicola lentus]RXK54686.1 DJ-1/PfpI family protein [Oleiharenicola lentus]
MKNRTVAILLFDDVEVLDFAGPFEVFSVTRELAGEKLFNVHTVGLTPGTIRARNGLKVVPEHTLETVPAPDLLLVPGGYGTRMLLNQARVVEWVRRNAAKAEIVASVCTGSLLLAKAGLLAGSPATTHFQCFDLLRELEPTATVREDVRFTDHGRILTAAGISAGIDLSLHIVARLHGFETAQRTAVYMEYHWRNDGGATR